MHVDLPWYEAPSKQTPSCTKQEQIPGTNKKNYLYEKVKGPGRMTKSRENFVAFKTL